MISGRQEGCPGTASGQQDSQEPVAPINGVLLSSRCVQENLSNKLQLYLLRLLGSGSKGTLSSSREAGRMASPWLPSSAGLKAFQESLLFEEMGSHSPKACIPTLSGCLSALSPTPIKKARGDPSTLPMLGTFKDTQLECPHQRPRTAEGSQQCPLARKPMYSQITMWNGVISMLFNSQQDWRKN